MPISYSQMSLQTASRRSRVSAQKRYHPPVRLVLMSQIEPLIESAHSDVKMQNILLTAKGVLKLGKNAGSSVVFAFTDHSSRFWYGSCI